MAQMDPVKVNWGWAAGCQHRGWVGRSGPGDGGIAGWLGVEFVARSQIWQMTEMDLTKVVWAGNELPAVGQGLGMGNGS